MEPISDDSSRGSTLEMPVLNVERIAAKATYASDVLKNIANIAQRLNKSEKILNRYLTQARMLLIWKRGSGAVKMAGSAAKTVSALMIIAAPLHARISQGIHVANRLWKLGAGLKILNAIANVIKDMWQKGCRSALLDFTQCAASLTRNLSVFGEVLRDLQAVAPVGGTSTSNVPDVFLNGIRDLIPPHQIPFATHVVNMVFGNERYSPLFAFTSIHSVAGNDSHIAQVMFEIEALHFNEFASESNSRSLVLIGSFLHVSRELFDFLDGLQSLTDRDCQFLQECLTKLSRESTGILKAVSVLISLDKIRKELNAEKAPSNTAPSPSLYDYPQASIPPSQLQGDETQSIQTCSGNLPQENTTFITDQNLQPSVNNEQNSNEQADDSTSSSSHASTNPLCPTIISKETTSQSTLEDPEAGPGVCNLESCKILQNTESLSESGIFQPINVEAEHAEKSQSSESLLLSATSVTPESSSRTQAFRDMFITPLSTVVGKSSARLYNGGAHIISSTLSFSRTSS